MKTHPSHLTPVRNSWLLIWGLACGLVPQAWSESVIYANPGSTVWTAPSGVTEVQVEVWGGGGRGGSRSSNGSAGGGGGGAYSRQVVTVVAGHDYTVHVGAGSSTTDAGGDSYFLNTGTVLAKGGGSVAQNSLTGAAGGAAASGVGSVRFSGGDGADGAGGNGGGGGSSAGPTSAGNPGSGRVGGVAPAGGGAGGNGADHAGNGNHGLTPGGGGGGARVTANTPRQGGRGADGRVVLTFEVALAADELAVTDQELTEAQGLADGGCIYRPMPGVINASGHVAFKAFGKVGTGGILKGNNALMLTHAGGSLHVIGREGTPVEVGSTASLNGLMNCLLLTAGGRTLFCDRLLHSPVPLDQAYFLSDNGLDLEILCRTGDSAPGGGALKTVNSSIVADSADRFYYTGTLVGAGITARNDTALCQEDAGTIRLLCREGADLTALTTDPAWLGNLSPDLSAAADGVALIATLQNHPTDESRKTDAGRNAVVLDGNEGGFQVIARKGDVVPETGGQILHLLRGVSRSATGAHALLARLKASTGVTSRNDLVLLSVNGGTVRLIAREGVTSIEGLAIKDVRAYYAIGDDEVIFLTDRALCRWTLADGVRVLACVGQAAPGLGCNHRSMHHLSVSEGGAIALTTTLDTGRGILWRALPGEALTYVLGTGDATLAKGVPSMVLALGLYADGTAATGGGGGRGAGINDSGTILATLSVGGWVHVARKMAVP